MSKVFWDTNLFIYLMEDTGTHAAQVRDLRRRMLGRNDQLYTSSLTLGELLVKPLEQGDADLERQYRELISSAAVVVPFDASAATRYARIRSDRGIRAPDAIQLACAAEVGTDLFITNDIRLSQKIVPGIQFIVALDQAFL